MSLSFRRCFSCLLVTFQSAFTRGVHSLASLGPFRTSTCVPSYCVSLVQAKTLPLRTRTGTLYLWLGLIRPRVPEVNTSIQAGSMLQPGMVTSASAFLTRPEWRADPRRLALSRRLKDCCRGSCTGSVVRIETKWEEQPKHRHTQLER